MECYAYSHDIFKSVFIGWKSISLLTFALLLVGKSTKFGHNSVRTYQLHISGSHVFSV